MKQKPAAAMHKSRAQRFTGRTRNGIVAWDVQPVIASGGISIAVDLRPREGRTKSYSMILDAEDAYSFREAIGYAYDRVYGL